VGASATLTAFGGTSYTWNNGVGAGNNVLVSPITTTTYTVTGTDANTCTNTAQMTVTVNAAAVINAGPDQTICLGQSATLNATGAPTITWDNGVVNNVAFSPVNTLTYTATGTDANGCIDTDDLVVTVSSLTTVNAGLDVEICEGETVILSASGANSYSWDNGVTNNVAFTPSVGTTTYTVTGTSAQGCTQQDNLIVTVNPNPQIQFIADTLKGCEGDIITFTNTTLNANLCSWSFSNGIDVNGCGPISIQFDEAGIFDVTLTVTNTGNCKNTLTKPAYIEIIKNPIADFNASNYVVSNFDTQILFSNESNYAVSYIWTFGDETPSTTVENPIHIFPSKEPGQYVVTLKAYNQFGCMDSIQRVIEVYEELIYYVPNTFTPDNDEYNPTFQPVFTAGFNPFDYSLLIFDRWGVLVFESHNAEIGWAGLYGVDGELCQDGTYTWKIEFKTNRSDERKILVGHVNLIR
jgi:gliding motility-associated-like protein